MFLPSEQISGSGFQTQGCSKMFAETDSLAHRAGMMVKVKAVLSFTLEGWRVILCFWSCHQQAGRSSEVWNWPGSRRCLREGKTIIDDKCNLDSRDRRGPKN